MKKPKLRELREAIKALIRGPYTSKFPAEEPYLPETFRGFPKFDPDKCVGCGACSEVCPPMAITVKDDLERGVRIVKVRYDSCIMCGQCERACIAEGGIKLSKIYDASTYDRKEVGDQVEKELVFCEICGSVITTKEQLLWISNKLGEKAFANPTLFLLFSGMESEEEPSHRFEDLPYRSYFMKILCPSCRRKAHLREEWG